jgi:hypothetical protein
MVPRSDSTMRARPAFSCARHACADKPRFHQMCRDGAEPDSFNVQYAWGQIGVVVCKSSKRLARFCMTQRMRSVP